MTANELWLTYNQASRAGRPSTAQLVDLTTGAQKLVDLEDVLDYIFNEGFVEPKYRPVSWWEKTCGEKVKGSLNVDELLSQGVGKCEETALRLIIADTPPVVWFDYKYTCGPVDSPVVKQRVKLEVLHGHCHVADPKMAHLTNYIFQQGYLPKHLRPKVHWESPCGTTIEEHHDLLELLGSGEGVSEERSLHLHIDDYFRVHHPHHDHDHHPHSPHSPHSPHTPHTPHFPHFPHHPPHHPLPIPHHPHHPHCGCP